MISTEILKTAETKLGNKIELIGEASDNNILIIGVVHGDEPQGEYLIKSYLEKSLSSKTMISKRERNAVPLFIPCLNPDGMHLKIRTNANGVDLNRNFPTKNWADGIKEGFTKGSLYYGGKAPASEIETQFLIDTIVQYSLKLVLTLHTPYKIVNYDGPAADIAQKISDIIKYPVEKSIGYPTPGSFGTYCGVERNIPTITLEMDEKIPVTELVQPVHKIFDILQI